MTTLLSHLAKFAMKRSLCLTLLLASIFAATASGAYNKVFFTTASATSTDDILYSADLDGANLTALASGTSLATQPTRVAFDAVNNKLYVLNGFNGDAILYRYDVTSGGTAVANKITIWSSSATAGMLAQGLAVDPAAGYVFFATGGNTGPSALDNVFRCGLDGSGLTTLSTNTISNPYDMAVDTVNQKLYVINRFTAANSLLRMNYDGSGGTTIASDTTAGLVYGGVTVDPANSAVFFTTGSATASDDKLYRCTLSGGSPTVLVSDTALALQPGSMAINLVTGKLYVCDVFNASGGVFSFNSNGTGRATIFTNAVANRTMNGVAVGTAPTAPSPTIASITPASGPTTGGSVVTITGTNFTGATGVTIGGTAVTSFHVISATSIEAVTPAHAAGSNLSVLVTTAGGSNTANSLFTYNAAVASTVVDFETASTGLPSGTTFTSGGKSWSFNGLLVDGSAAGLGSSPVGSATPASNHYLDTSYGTARSVGSMGAIIAPAGNSFRAVGIDIWPSSSSGIAITPYTSTVNGFSGETGHSFTVKGYRNNVVVVNINVIDTLRTPPQSGSIDGGYWHHLEFTNSAFDTTDIDKLEIITLTQSGTAFDGPNSGSAMTTPNYIALDNFVYSNLTAPTPVVTVPGGTTTLTATTSGSAGVSANFSITGANLTGAPGNLTVTAPANVEVSANNSTWGGTASIPYSSATLASTPVYIRLAGTGAVGTISGNVSITGGGLASAVTQAVSGTLNAPPASVTVPGGTTTLTTTAFGTAGGSVNFNITGANLTGAPGNLTVTAPANVQVSADNSTWGGTASIPYSSATLASTSVFVRLAGTGTVGTISGNVSISGAGLGAAVTQAVSGTLNAAPTPPTVTTATQSAVTATSATLGGNVTADGGASVTERGIVWKTSTGPTTADNKVANGSGTGTFSATVSSLPAGTTVFVRAYAINSVSTSYGSEISFTTLSNNANLSALALTTATINETFAAATTSYTSSVPNATSSVTVTPTRAQANATIEARVGANAFASVTSGSPSASLALAVGANTIEVKVTAQDTTTIKTYTITVTRAGVPVQFDLIGTAGSGLLFGNEPAVASGGTGGEVGAGISFDPGTNILTLNVGWGSSQGFTDLSSSSNNSHIHGPTAANNGSGFTQTAGVLFNLSRSSNAVTGGTFTTTLVTLTAGQATDLNNGKYYINIHTVNNGGGELRGFLVPVSTTSTITGVSPSNGSTAGGTPVTITGTNLSGATNVTIGGVPATSVNVVNATTITATTGAHAAGLVNASALTAGGNVTGTGLFTYTVPLSNNANLASLTLGTGTLTPVFAAGTTSYTATVLKASATITVTPTVAESHATLQVRVNGGSYTSVTSGSASGSLTLNLGANPINVLVTAQDGTTTKTYTTTVTRWTNFQNWRNQYFSTIANSGSAADTATPQNDGLPNLLKFAMGLDPTKNVLVADSIAKSGNNLQFNYQRNIEAMGEVTFIVEWSDTLQSNDWHTSGVTEAILSATSTLQQVRATVDGTGVPRRFMRLRVTDP